MWADSPRECLYRGLVPVRLLDPTLDETAEWVEVATAHLDPSDDVDDIGEYKRLLIEATAFRDNLKKLLAEKRDRPALQSPLPAAPRDQRARTLRSVSS